MYQIAICDDDRHICKQLEKILYCHAEQLNLAIDIDLFYTAESLCDYLSDETKLHIIFLDIEFKNMNGIEAGRMIRNKLNNHLVDIVFVTHTTQFMHELFSLNARDFIAKPLDLSLVIEVFDNIIDSYQNHTKLLFDYHNGSDQCLIDINEIMYLRVKGRLIYIKTTRSTDFFYGSLKKVNERLKKHAFLKANKNYVVNPRYVSTISGAIVCMTDGHEISLTKGRLAQFRHIDGVVVI
jgi:DNA-binding LytR/AlgR family response regulator